MVRRIASQVHKQAARLMRSDFLAEEPAWFKAVLEHPPLPLPPRKSAPRTDYDLPPPKQSAAPTKMKPYTPCPLQISYVEDDVRRQFFKDHPFEAFRARSLAEGAGIADEHPIRGKVWTRLRQRGRNPSPEDAIRYAINLFEHHSFPLTQAYAHAIAQFRSLRSEHHIATTVAALEAESHGSVFGVTEINRGFMQELTSLKSWERRAELDEGAMAARKRWKAIVERKHGLGEWSKGQEYVRLWKEGVRPTYAPSLTEPSVTPSKLSSQDMIAQNASFLRITR